MYVVGVGLDAGDLGRLERACAQGGLTLREGAELDGFLPDGLLAVFTAKDSDPGVVRGHGAYPVLVQDSLSPIAVLSAIRSGFSFVFTSPLDEERLAPFLAYLRDVAPPEQAQLVVFDEARRRLSTADAEVPLTVDETAVLRVFAGRADRIVPRSDLSTAVRGGDVRQTVDAVRRRLTDLGSGAQILNVPHMGYRFVGGIRVREAAVD